MDTQRMGASDFRSDGRPSANGHEPEMQVDIAAGFELFTRQPAPKAESNIAVTLQRHGLMTFNRAAFEAMGKPPFVELLYNRDDNVIGIRPTVSDAPWAYKLRQEERSKMFKISFAAFRRHFGLPPVDRAQRYQATMIGTMLLVDLKQVPQITSTDQAPDEAF